MRDAPKNKPTTIQVFRSVLASFVGIQSNKNHDRDDSFIDEVGFRPYIVAGIVLTLAFVIVIWLIVKLIVDQ